MADALDEVEPGVQSPLLPPYHESYKAAIDDSTSRTSSLWDENNLPDFVLDQFMLPAAAADTARVVDEQAPDQRHQGFKNLLEDDALTRSAPELTDDEGEPQGFRFSVPEAGDDGTAWDSDDADSEHTPAVLQPPTSPEKLPESDFITRQKMKHARSIRHHFQSSLASPSVAKPRSMPKLAISRKRPKSNRNSDGLQLPKVTTQIPGRLQNPLHPQVVLDKLQEKGRTGHLEGEDKNLAKLLRWKLRQIAQRRKQELQRDRPARGWALLQQLIRQTSDEFPSITPSINGMGEPDSVDVFDSIGVAAANSAEAVFALVDESSAPGPVMAALKQVPHHILIQTVHPSSRLNILQHALTTHKFEIARSLVEFGGSDLVLVSNFKNALCADEIETCLHRVVALGDLPLVRAVLETFDATARADYLAAETLLVLCSSRSLDADETPSPVQGESKQTSIVALKERTKGSVLHLAALLGYLDIVRYLVNEVRVPVNGRSNRGATPVCLAVAHNHLPVVEFLHGAGADLSIVDATRRTFLHYAILSGSEQTVDFALALFSKLSEFRGLCLDENPLVMASWHGSSAVVRALLRNSDICGLCNQSTTHHGNTALHVACSHHNAEGTDIVRQLLEVGARADVRNRDGKTPLMWAAEVGAVDAIVLLAEYMTTPKARYFQALHENGKSVWDYAIGLPSNESLIALLEVARFCCDTDNGSNSSLHGTDTGTGLEGPKLHTFVRMPASLGGTTPLHMAAAKGDVAKLRVMLKYGFPPEKTVDSKGDTFLHTAAREGQLKVIRTFATRPIYVNRQNADGDSVMSVACSAGQEACASALLPKADVSLLNRRSRTAVHELCTLPDLPYALLRDVVKRTIDVSWDMLGHKDSTGRTALHHLAIHPNLVDREMVFKLFHQSFASNPICNTVRIGGYTPLHDALHHRCVDNACALLKTFGPSLEVNAQDEQGCTPMHVAVRECLVEAVLPLVQAGGDLLVSDKRGDTPLHKLVSCASERPKHLNEYVKLLHKILDCTVIWYCKFKDIMPIPKQSSDGHNYKQYLKSAVTLLLTAVYNARDMNVLMWATYKCGACTELLASLLTVPDVFCLQRVGRALPRESKQDHIYYDVTDIVPDTIVPLRQAALLDSGITATDLLLESAPYADRPVQNVMKQAYSSMASDAEWQTSYNAKPALVRIIRPKYRKSSPKQSLVELIVGIRDRVSEQRWQLLDVTPIREITKDYWEPYKYIYAVVMVAHITYMSVFSELSLQMTMSSDLTCSYGTNETSGRTASHAIRRPPAKIGSHFLLLVWPCLIIIADMLYCALYFQRRLKSCRSDSTSWDLRRLVIQPFRQLEVIYIATYWLFGVVFSWMAVAWFILYAIGDCHQDYILAVVMICGWLYTINFTQGIRGVHHFSLVLQRIVLKDFLKFAFVFASLLVGYSYAFQVLTLAIPSLRSQYPSIGYTFFTAFNWLIGMDEFYKVQRDEFERHGKDIVVLMATFVSYILLLNIVLVNLLVAIMNDSYSSIYQRHQLVWRIHSLQHALNIENHFPFVGNILRKLRNQEIVKDSFSQHKRFYLKVAQSLDHSAADADTSEQYSLAAIANRLDSLAVTSDRLEHSMVELKDRLEMLTANERKQPPSSPLSPIQATASAAGDEAERKLSEYVKSHILAELMRKVKPTM